MGFYHIGNKRGIIKYVQICIYVYMYVHEAMTPWLPSI